MKSRLMTWALAPALLTMIACEPIQISQKSESDKDKKGDKAPTSFNIQKSKGPLAQEEIDRRVRMAELLAQSPVGFPHAKWVLDDVLEKDPENDKALFYSAMMDLVFSVKGVYGKAEKLYDNPADAERLRSHVSERLYPEYMDFMFKHPGKKYDTYAEGVDDVLTRTQNAYKTAAAKLGRIDDEFELIFTNLKTSNDTVEYNCQTYDDGMGRSCELKDTMTGISVLDSTRKKVAPGDAKAIKGYVLGMLNYSRLYHAYSIEGQKELSAEIDKKQEDFGRDLTDLERDLIVKKYPQYLTLKDHNELPEIVASLEEIGEIALDIEGLNNQFCTDEARENYLIGQICLKEGTRENIEKTLEMLAGPVPMTIGMDENGDDVQILTDLPGFLANPVQDLKSLYNSVDYDAQGASSIVREPELNGLFPNKDYLEKMGQVASEL